MSENSLPNKPYYRVSDLAKRWKISEEEVMEYVRCDMLAMSTYIKDQFADISKLVPDTSIYTDPGQVDLDGIYPIDGTNAILAFYAKDDSGVFVKEYETKGCRIKFSSSVYIHRDHLLISKEDLASFEKEYKLKHDEKILDQKSLSDREKGSFLLMIGALAESIANDHGNKFKKKDRPNVSQIAAHVLELVGDNVYGIGKSSLSDRISKGLKLLEEAKKK